MASFEVTGFINTIKYLPDACIVYVDEFKGGHTTSKGVVVEDKYLSWKIIYKAYFKDFVAKHFNKGMLVNVKGEVLPFGKKGDEYVDGYSILGQTINIASYPRAFVKKELMAQKDSQLHSHGTPDLEGYMEEDF